MRVSREEMQRSHKRIIEGAARLFRERGLEGTSVADAMNDAGMTHGGFYRHFATKDDLVSAAIREAFDQSLAGFEGGDSDSAAGTKARKFRQRYLMKGHVENPGIGCPVAALAGELSRASAPSKKTLSDGVDRIVSLLSRAHRGSEDKRSAEAIREFAMMLGAVILARASDPDMAARILAACRAEIDWTSKGG